MATRLIRAVIDTNVVFEGLTKAGGACGLIIEAWLDKKFLACCSLALEYEYVDVLKRKLSPAHWQSANPTLRVLLDLTEPVTPYFSWRPASPDPGDDFLIDCAMNANAPLVTGNVKDMRQAQQRLGLNVLKPAQFVAYLAARAAKE